MSVPLNGTSETILLFFKALSIVFFLSDFRLKPASSLTKEKLVFFFFKFWCNLSFSIGSKYAEHSPPAGFFYLFAAYPYFLKKKLQSPFCFVIRKGPKIFIKEELNITTPSFLLSTNSVAHSRVPRNDIILSASIAATVKPGLLKAPSLG